MLRPPYPPIFTFGAGTFRFLDRSPQMKKATSLLFAIAFAGGAAAIGINCSKGSASGGGIGNAAKSAEAGDAVRLRVAPDGPSKGAADAKVTIVEFSDFQCPFCSRVVPTVEQILKTYPNDVRVVFRHNPLPFHPNAQPSAEAAVAAAEQGKFWPMHDKLFANQQNLTRPDFEKYAGEIGLDMGKFKSALDSGAGKKKVADDLADAGKIGVQGTPNFYIDGINVQGAQPFDEFKKVIDAELANKK
jgi:protein-disulfide isomerase